MFGAVISGSRHNASKVTNLLSEIDFKWVGNFCWKGKKAKKNFIKYNGFFIVYDF